MGRAIDHENSIDELKMKMKKLENIVRGMVSRIDEIDNKSSKTKHVDLTEVNKKDTSKSKKVKEKNETEKTNDEGNGKGSGNDDTKPKHSKSKGSKSRTSN